MPLVDVNDPAVWSSLYYSGPYDCGYDRLAKYDFLGANNQDGRALLAALVGLGMTKQSNIAIFGAGFGWVAEDWVADGYVNVRAFDPSTWIQAHKSDISLVGTPQASITIAQEDGMTGASRGNIRRAFGSGNPEIHWGVSEDLVGFLSDAECAQYATILRGLCTRVAHWITVGARKEDNPAEWAGDPRLNWKTLAGWKTLLTPDVVVQRQPPYTVL